MTPKEAFQHLVREFPEQFGADAEGCCETEATIGAIKTLATHLGLAVDLSVDPFGHLTVRWA